MRVRVGRGVYYCCSGHSHRRDIASRVGACCERRRLTEVAPAHAGPRLPPQEKWGFWGSDLGFLTIFTNFHPSKNGGNGVLY